MNRRQFLAVLAATPAIVTLAACATSPSATPTSPSVVATTAAAVPTAAQTVSIRFDSYNWGTPGLGGQGTQQLIDEFQAANPTIVIQPRNVASTDILKSTVAQAAAGDPPDIAQLVLNNIDFVVGNLPVQPLDQIAPKDEFDATMQHILPQAARLGQVNGHQYGGPYTFSTPTLFYNGDVFKAAGLDPANPPTTWEQVRQAAQAIKDRTSSAPLNIGGLYGADWIAQSLINSNGGTTLAADRSHATFNEPPAVEVLRWWQGLVDDGLYPKLSDPDAQASMTNGSMGMYLNTTVLLPALRAAADGKWDLRTAGEPSFGSKPVAPTNSGQRPVCHGHRTRQAGRRLGVLCASPPHSAATPSLPASSATCPSAMTSWTIRITSSRFSIRTRACCRRSDSWAACRPGRPGRARMPRRRWTSSCRRSPTWCTAGRTPRAPWMTRPVA